MLGCYWYFYFMNTLYILNEVFTEGYISNTLNIVSLLAIFSGIFVLISNNPVISVLFLISLFGSISVYLNLIGLSFVALSYLIVYIGAVSILFLFILMLINIRLSELQENTINSIPLAIIMIIFLIYTLFQILPHNLLSANNYDNVIKGDILYKNQLNFLYDSDLLFVTSSAWENNLMEINHISSIGNVLYTSHNIWLIITSFILLLAMVGAIIITIKQK